MEIAKKHTVSDGTFPNWRYPFSRLCHCISLISKLAIPKLDVDFCELYINVAVSCKRYPPSVQTCGKRWDLPKFVDVLSVNLGFSRLLIWILPLTRISK